VLNDYNSRYGSNSYAHGNQRIEVSKPYNMVDYYHLTLDMRECYNHLFDIRMNVKKKKHIRLTPLSCVSCHHEHITLLISHTSP